MIPVVKIQVADISKAMGHEVHIARLDRLHPVISGNKIFKLKYFIIKAKEEGISRLLTYGGPYSNHLAAAAFACREAGLELTAIIRGEEPPVKSHTLAACESYGMKCHYLQRKEYAEITKGMDPQGALIVNDQLVIPEGGYHLLGMKGASEISDAVNAPSYTHVCLASGTATTLAGMLASSKPGMSVMAVNVLKGESDIRLRLEALGIGDEIRRLQITEGYHFGGYASHHRTLFEFMNAFHNETGIPTDFVYTGRLLFAVKDLITLNRFPPGSRLLCLHTGGLQGNASLPEGTLHF